MGPIFRWAGSKDRIKEQVLTIIRGPNLFCPPCHKVQHEKHWDKWISPFFGAGSIEFEAMRRGLAKEYVFGEALHDIIATLAILKFDDLTWLFSELESLRQLSPEEQEALFLDQRRAYSTCFRPQVVRRFLILQACSFNGLWRVNQSGGYNVPFGLKYKDKKTNEFRYSKPHLALEALREASELLRRYPNKFACRDFAQTIAQAGANDIVYSDPPYLGQHSDYGAVGFTLEDHARLSIALQEARARGAECWLSGSNCDETRTVYPGEVFEIEARRSISCKSETRGKKKELLIRM